MNLVSSPACACCFGSVALVGRWPVRLILYPVSLWYFLTKPAARAASSDYLQRAAEHGAGLNDLGKLGVFRHFVAFAESILDKMLLWSGLFDTDSVKHHGQSLIAAEIAKKRGGVLICCHLGNLDLCRVLSRQMAGFKMTVLIHTKHAQRFNRLLAQLNADSQVNLMQVTELSAATAVLLSEKVARGEFVAIAGDRIPVTPKPRVAMAEFFGAPAPFPVGPYILADLLQCPVFLLFTPAPRAHFGNSFRAISRVDSSAAPAARARACRFGCRVRASARTLLPARAVAVV